MRAAWTSPDGAFLLTGLEAGLAHQVHALKAGYAPAVASAPPKAHSTVHLTLRTARTVAGRVLENAGAPVAGARVALLDESALSDDNLWVLLPDVTKTTDVAGRFAFHKVPPQVSILAVVAAGQAPLFRFDLKVPHTAAVTDLGDLTLAPEAFVRGRVVDSGGKPVAGAQVRRETYSRQSTLLDAFLRKKRPSWPLSATTGADGSFELGRFAAGEGTVLDVVAQGFASAETEATAGPDAKPVKVTLWAAASVAGVVTDEAGRPVAHAAVAPAGAGLGGSEFRWVTTDGQGRFEVQGVAPGRVLLRAQGRGYAMSEVVGVDVAPGGHVDGVHLVLRAARVLRGRVVRPDGRPAEGVQVSARPGSIVATTGPDGAFSISDLPSGEVVLDLRRKGFLPYSKTVELDPGGVPTEIQVPVAEVAGVLLGPDRKPAAGREIGLLPKDSRIVWGEGFATKTAADGSFRFRGVADGTWVVKVAWPKSTWSPWTSPEPVVVQAGRSITNLEVRLPPEVPYRQGE
jgi:protocatechuate 3,4-dioxygenase beta subunit